MDAADVDQFVAALVDRHTASLERPALLKAIRALSARYVERRDALPGRSPLDSAGKRAAFAAYYAPQHFLLVGEMARHLTPARPLDRLVDLGCGTGVSGAAWALALPSAPVLHGIDRSGWALAEAAWTYRTLGLAGRVSRGDLVRAAARLEHQRSGDEPGRTGVLLAWSANELDPAAWRRLLSSLLHLGRRGAAVLVVEPVSRRAAPWWDDWAEAFGRAGGRQDECRFEHPRPASLAALDEAAGFARDSLVARSVALNLT